jgi:hypothetical protein
VTTDVTIAGHGCRLTLRISHYEFPELSDADDGSWLVGEAELKSGITGRFHARHELSLRTDDLDRFRNELSQLLSSLSGSATLPHLEARVGCSVELIDGRGKLSAFLGEHAGSELSISNAETDQSYLAQTLSELNSVLTAFPIR